MARGPYWLCSDIKTIRRNLDKTDADLAAMFPGRNVKAVETVRRRFGLAKCPQRAPHLPRYPRNPLVGVGIQTENAALKYRDIPE
jgi:hypothetical protein